ncbi:MAG: hypothetical protein QW051_00070 [Candidatus Aenigmatarchaeota archaeon]
MSLKEEVKGLFEKLIGKEAGKIIESFDDPEKYPEDFCKECIEFLSKFIGEEAARKKINELYQKYKSTTTNLKVKLNEKNTNCSNCIYCDIFDCYPDLHFKAF